LVILFFLTGAGKAFASYSHSTLTGRHRLLLLYTMFCKFLKRLEADWISLCLLGLG